MTAPFKVETQPLLASYPNQYGSQAGAQTPNQNPTQPDPTLVLARAMEAIVKQQMAAKQSSQQPPQIAQATIQQTLTLPEGQYIGDVQNGQPHGRGTLTYYPGMERKKYEGEWKDGKFHGRGALLFSSEDRQEGQWENGKFHGRGLTFHPDGKKYDGEVSQDKAHGKGTMRYADGSTYVVESEVFAS